MIVRARRSHNGGRRVDGVAQFPYLVGAAADRHFHHARAKPSDFIPANEIDDVVRRIGGGAGS